SPTNALVSHPSLRIVATSTTDASTAGDVTVNVDITRVRGLSVGLDSTTAAFDGRFLNYTLHVKNEGNARETVQVEVTNPNDLAPGTVTVTGPDITRAAPLNTPLVAVAIGAAAAIAVGVYLTRKRR